MKIKRIGNPVMHSNSDPTGIGRLRTRAHKDMQKRIRFAYDEIKQLIKSFMEQSLVGTEVVNQFVINRDNPQIITNKTNYIYEYSPERLGDVKYFIDRILNKNLLGDENKLWSLDWWFNQYATQASNSGLADSLDSAQSIATPEAVGEDVSYEVKRLGYEGMLDRPHYRRALNAVYSRTFNQMEGFVGANSTKLAEILGTAVASGESYRSVAKRVNQELIGVEGYRSLRIVRTELNKAYTDSYMSNARELNKTTFTGKYEIRQMHISVLDPTRSRITHMRRHGKIYTIDEQEEWWNDGANRINCLCSVVDVMVNTKTGEVLQKALVKAANLQRDEMLGVKG